MRIRFLVIFILSVLEIKNVPPARSQQASQSHVATWAVMFQSQVNRCWKKYTKAAKDQTADVIFEIKLKRDGTLEGPPVPVGTLATPELRLFQENAARALVECQPYQLPAEYYDEWKYFAPSFRKVPLLHR